jgi:cytochrome P450
MSKLTDEEVYEEALTFGKDQFFIFILIRNIFSVTAGHETTSTLLVWTLFNLANNPDVCRRLEAEIDSVLHDNEEITASTLSLLTYTDAVLKESLRLHQPVPSIARIAVEDNTLIASDGKQIHVKKGTDIMVNFFILHQ